MLEIIAVLEQQQRQLELQIASLRQAAATARGAGDTFTARAFDAIADTQFSGMQRILARTISLRQQARAWPYREIDPAS